MAALDLGDMADFPFVDPPESRNIADGVRLLEELGAFGGRGQSRLTETGRKLARLPVDPRLGRMILEAGHNGCVREVLIITAALSIVDPRERPTDNRPAADAMHARFAVPGSDFLAFLELWDYLRRAQRELSASAFRRMCKREFLHYLRVREWQDVYGQLRQAAADVGVVIGRDRRTPAPPAGEDAERFPPELADRVHMSLLAGLLSHLGMQQTDAQGARPAARARRIRRGPRRAVRHLPRLGAGPEAARLGGRGRTGGDFPAVGPGGRADRAGVGRVARPPTWSTGTTASHAGMPGAVRSWPPRRVSLYGLPIVAGRPVNYGRIDPVAARELFIQHALVEGDWQTHHRFWAHNQRMLAQAEELEAKARRRGIVADDAARFDFYDQRIPAEVVSARHFDSWWKQARAADPDLLNFSLADLVSPAGGDISPDDYPGRWAGFPVSYEFAPGEPDDGVTVDIPLAQLNQVNGDEFSWQVPGLREETVTELIRSLPKQLRTQFVPVPDTARAVLPRLRPGGDLLDALGAELTRLSGVPVPRSAWDESRLPSYLRVTFQVVDDGRVLASGKDLAELRRELRPRLQATLGEAARGLTRTGLRTWDMDTLPRVFTHGQVRAYPALADAGDSVDIRLFDTQAEADAAMRRGTRRLVLLQVPSGVRAVAGRLPVSAKLAMSRHPYRSTDALLEDCAAAAADQIIAEAGGPAWDAAGFARLLDAARDRLAAVTADVVSRVAQVLAESHEAEASLGSRPAPALAAAFDDMRAPAGRAHSAGVHRRDRRPAAARPAPLPAGDKPAAGEAARLPGP